MGRISDRAKIKAHPLQAAPFLLYLHDTQNVQTMKVKEIVSLVAGEMVGAAIDPEYEITKAFASDLMSDVLTLKDTPILITGLCNVQTIRTCDMAGLEVAIIVRNKKPSEEMLELAEENDMTIIACPYSLFKACGLLYDAGVQPLY